MPIDAKANRLLRLQQHVEQLDRYISELQSRSNTLSQWRLSVFFGGGLVSLIGIEVLPMSLSLLLWIIVIGVFGYLVRRHQQINGRLVYYQNWQHIKQQHIACMTIDWEQLPTPPDVHVPDEHPFATDINIAGSRSLLHLVDTTMTYEGAQTLTDWLLQTTPMPQQTRRRQQFVRDTRDMWRFRDKLQLYGRLAGHQNRIHGKYILDWFTQSVSNQNLRPTVLLAWGLAATTAVLLLGFLLVGLPPLFVGSLLLYGVVIYRQLETISERFANTRSLHRYLSRLQGVFAFLENTHHPALDEQLQPFHQQKPSQALRRLTQLMVAASAQQNPFLAFFLNIAVPYDLTIAYLLDQQKEKLSSQMQEWLSAWFQLEALNALANFAYLNPQHIFPEFEDGAGLQATALGHPLLKDEQRVSNDFVMAHTQDVVIITGSNMAGKSTFLRTLGVSIALAYAGGAVQAEHLKLAWLRLFTAIKVSDSINDGISYFYAEVRRLKALLNELDREHPYPLFFMIDEIFKGTNNRERLIGSRAYIRTVAQKNGIGLVATHDLELVKLADEFDAIRNFHFREDVIEGKMVFDYLIRQGPSPTTNALKIMEIEGLPVE